MPDTLDKNAARLADLEATLQDRGDVIHSLERDLATLRNALRILVDSGRVPQEHVDAAVLLGRVR